MNLVQHHVLNVLDKFLLACATSVSVYLSEGIGHVLESAPAPEAYTAVKGLG